jgi:hypothetical protein
VRDVMGGNYDFSTKSMRSGSVASSDYKQKYADLKADFDDPNNGWSNVEKAKKGKELKKLSIQKDYDKDTVDLYSMSKADMYDYVSKAPNGKELADKLIAYDNALYDAGLSAYKKYKNGVAPATKTSRGGKGGKGKKKGSSFDYTKNMFASTSSSNTKSLRKILEAAMRA